MISLIVLIYALIVVALAIWGFAKNIKFLKIISLCNLLVLLGVAIPVFYTGRTQNGNAFVCDSKDEPISSCTYVSNVRFNYDSMDGADYLEEINQDDIQFRFEANDCVLKSSQTKIGECKDTTGKNWAIILSGGRP